MSDNPSAHDELPVSSSSTVVGLPSVVRWFIVINSLVGGVLILAWLAFAFGNASRRTTDASDSSGKPLSSATDSAEEDDTGDGKPKVIKVEMKWPATGVSDFSFVERSGKTVTKADLAGHPWVVSFIFTNCAGPCFKVTSAMRRLQDEFLKDTDLRLVTITVDPERDSPAVLTKYANGFQADEEHWLFLTDPSGSKDKIYPLIWGSFLMPVQEAKGEMREPGYEFIHTNNVLLVDENGVVQGKWLSTDEAEFDQLRRELKKRLKRKTQESVSDLENASQE